MQRSSQETATRRLSVAAGSPTDDEPRQQSMNGNHRKAVPGRPRRRRLGGRRSARGSRKTSFWRRCYSRWLKDFVTSFSSLFLAVLLWYSLGVISIGSSKLLLTKSKESLFVGVSPLFLTIQQLLIGSSLLRILLKIRFLRSSGLQPWPATSSTEESRHAPHSSKRKLDKVISSLRNYPPDLFFAGMFFSVGFLATNYGFSGSSASFVETIKAAEPITSATVAVWWGIEVLSRHEVTSLGAIVTGVLLSTLGNRHHLDESTSTADSFRACLIVMTANLCFSFRGLYQKLFRSSRGGSTQVVDDINLQFRMQQVGVGLLLIPVLIWNAPGALWHVWSLYAEHGIFRNGLLVQYIGLSLINGCAFASYNLASTYILSRISVVHHAALNCIRRIFAIVVTSIVFDVPITLLGGLGIAVSFVGFLSFTHFKVQRQRAPKPVSSLLPVSVADHSHIP